MSRGKAAKVITVAQVVAYARQLERNAVAALELDPWANPYRLTEEGARTLVKRTANKLLDDLPDTATVGQYDAARADAPRQALIILQGRERAAIRDRAAEKEADARERRRVEKKLDRARRQRNRSGLTYGQRIDQALALAAIVSSAPAAKAPDPDLVSGSRNHDDQVRVGPAWHGDPYSDAERIARKAAGDVEELLDGTRWPVGKPLGEQAAA